MKLKPSMRTNRRYVLVEADHKEDVKKVILEYLGILGLAKMNLLCVKEDGKKILFSIDRKEVNNLRAAIECSELNIRILKVSGTIKGIGG